MSKYELKAGIYKITSPKGKIYIGRSINILKRWNEHKNKTNSLIFRSIVKYGYENHTFEVLCYTTTDTHLLNKMEIFYINKYDSTNISKGLNLISGGGRLNFSHSKETINKMKLNRKGKQNSKGRVHSNETKNKIRNSLLGKKLNDDHKINVMNARFERELNLILIDTNTGVFYLSKNEAVKASGISWGTFNKRMTLVKNFRYTLA